MAGIFYSLPQGLYKSSELLVFKQSFYPMIIDTYIYGKNKEFILMYMLVLYTSYSFTLN